MTLRNSYQPSSCKLSGKETNAAENRRNTTAKQKYTAAADEHRQNKKAIEGEWTQRGATSNLRATTYQTAIPKVYHNSNDFVHEIVGEQRGPKVETAKANAEVPFASEVHPSHREMLIRNIVFCKRCGYWGSKKAQKLIEPCRNEPQHSDGRAKLKRMLDGYHPDRNVKTWSGGLSTNTKVAVICLDE